MGEAPFALLANLEFMTAPSAEQILETSMQWIRRTNHAKSLQEEMEKYDLQKRVRQGPVEEKKGIGDL